MRTKILVAAGFALLVCGPAAAQLPGIDAPTGAAGADPARKPAGEAGRAAPRSNADADVTRRGTTSDETARNRITPKRSGVGGGPSLDAKVEGSGPVTESGVGSADTPSGSGRGAGGMK